MTLDQTLTVAIVVSSIIAGLCWLRSATAKIRPATEKEKLVGFQEIVGDGPGEYRMIIDGVDVLPTAALQSWWNARAAVAASAAALLQAWQAILHW
jgi:hypothetical protein